MLQPNPQRESANRLPLIFQKEEIMFQFNYKLEVAERVKAKCERHPRYNPTSRMNHPFKIRASESGGCVCSPFSSQKKVRNSVKKCPSHIA
jgi:hypothetical protein